MRVQKLLRVQFVPDRYYIQYEDQQEKAEHP